MADKNQPDFDYDREGSVEINQTQAQQPVGEERGEVESFEPDPAPKNSKGKWIIFAVILALLVALPFLFIKFKPSVNQTVESVSDTEADKVPVVEVNDEDVHYLGILPLHNPSEMLSQFGGVEKYLSENTGLNIKLRLYPTTGELGGYTAVVKDISNGEISFAYLASVTTIQANGNGPVIPFACAQKSGSPTYRGDLVVRKDSSYQRLEDLQGKKVTGTSMSSTSGGLMPVAWMKSINIDPETYFDGGLAYLGSHDKAAEAVIKGTFDGAFVNESTKNKFNKDGEVLRSIWRHDPVPEFPFVVNTEKVSAEDLQKVKDALLKMHETHLEGITSIEPKYEKWVEINWEDYLGIKEAVDEVHGEIFYDLDKWGGE